jgi:Zn-dependent protease with chaperone function
MKILLIVAMAMIGGKARAETGGALEHVVPVCMSEGVRTPDMYLARAIVSEMFEKIGVTIEWRQERLCRSLSGVISIKLSDDTPANQFAGALAYALPFEGSRIIIFYDRVRRTVQPMVVPHLLAHEIAHVIEGTDVHSDRGVMKAHWDLSDQDRMYRKPLTFSEVDVSLIQNGLAARR